MDGWIHDDTVKEIPSRSNHSPSLLIIRCRKYLVANWRWMIIDCLISPWIFWPASFLASYHPRLLAKLPLFFRESPGESEIPSPLFCSLIPWFPGLPDHWLNISLKSWYAYHLLSRSAVLISINITDSIRICRIYMIGMCMRHAYSVRGISIVTCMTVSYCASWTELVISNHRQVSFVTQRDERPCTQSCNFCTQFCNSSILHCNSGIILHAFLLFTPKAYFLPPKFRLQRPA